MDANAVLIKILSATEATALFTRSDYKKMYVQFLKLVHPDVCAHPLANKAAQRLLEFKKQMEALEEIEDDAGKLQKIDTQRFVFQGDADFLKKSYDMYQTLMNLSDSASQHFKKYLPVGMTFEHGSLKVDTGQEAYPLTGLKLEQHHVTWIASRLYEVIAWLHQIGWAHLGLNPESIAVVPKTHGIILLSFYHCTPLGEKMSSISGRYLNWYPTDALTHKIAHSYFDLALAQRTAIYLLGDPSGNGVKLKKTHSERLIDFWIAPHDNAYETYKNYRNLLYDLWGSPKFYPLIIR